MACNYICTVRQTCKGFQNISVWKNLENRRLFSSASQLPHPFKLFEKYYLRSGIRDVYGIGFARKNAFSTLFSYSIAENVALSRASYSITTTASQDNEVRTGARHCSTRVQYKCDLQTEDKEFDVDEEELDALRKQHRKVASNCHSSVEDVTFKDFALNDRLLESLSKLGYKEPFEIQSKTLPHTLQSKDVVGRAVTGSGKTLAFSIPIVHKIAESKSRPSRSPKALVISPTRELCNQIYKSINELDQRVRCVPLYGGASMLRQEQTLSRGVHVVCATPGRLVDHLNRGNINLAELSFLCLDESDELLNPNFKEEVLNILHNSPPECQKLLFSATLPRETRAIIDEFMKNPMLVDITQNQKLKVPESVRHVAIKMLPSDYWKAVGCLLEEHKPQRCLIFTETKVKAREAALLLKGWKISAEAIHSDLSQSRRENVLAAFRKGLIQVLTATDVAARGWDVPEIELVIQVGPPANGLEYYIHRSGRTGRGGRDGLSILLHCGRPNEEIVGQIVGIVNMEHQSPPEGCRKIHPDLEEKMMRTPKKGYKKSPRYFHFQDYSDSKKSQNFWKRKVSNNY